MTSAARRSLVEERGSGTQERVPEPRFLAVGQVIGAHGIRGELKVGVLTEDADRFSQLERVFLGPDGQEPAPWRMEGARVHQGNVLLKLVGIDDRSAALNLRGHLVLIPREEALPLQDGEYYEYQIVGLEVWTTAGEFLGKVVDILYTGANEVYVVQQPGLREILIPAIADVVQEVNVEAGRLVVELLEGLV